MTDSNYTHLAIIADRSGSMDTIEKDMNGGLKTLLADQDKQPGKLVVDVTTFDDTVETPYVGVKASDVEFPVIVPRGWTALNDALGQTIVKLGESLNAMSEQDRPGKVIVVVITDGGENRSVEYAGPKGANRVKALLEHQRDTYNWEFLFLAANIDAFAVGANFGFAKGSTMGYAANGQSAVAMAAGVSSYLTRSRVAGGDTQFTDAERLAAQQV